MPNYIDQIREQQHSRDYSIQFDTSLQEEARRQFDKESKDRRMELIREWVGDQAITELLTVEYEVDFALVSEHVQDMIDDSNYSALYDYCEEILGLDVMLKACLIVFDSQIEYKIIREDF